MFPQDTPSRAVDGGDKPITGFPQIMQTALLDIEHPDRALYKESWTHLRLLNKNGSPMRKQATEFLLKRPKELTEVFAERVRRFTSQGIVGSIVSWYIQTMFRNDPEVYLKTPAGGDVDQQTSDWYEQWQLDCDRGGTSYVNFWRDALESALLYKRAYILIDTPADTYDPDNQPASLAQQKESGALDPYLVLYTPDNVQNWATDRYGKLRFILFKVTESKQEFGQNQKLVDRWYYFDRDVCAVYEAERKDDTTQEEPKAKLVFGPQPHAMSDQERVPVRVLEMPDGACIGQRIYLDAMAHNNMRNAYFWCLFISCLPMLYVKGRFLSEPTLSEVGYLEIEKDSEIGYVEPTGKSHETVAKEITTLREEIYRQAHLQAQGKQSSASADGASGDSKEMEWKSSTDILNGIGGLLRACYQLVLADVADIRVDKIKPDVNGFQFDDVDEAKELATIQVGKDLQIQSKRMEKELDKRAARLLLRGRNPDVIEEVEGEIEDNPTASELAAQQQAQQQAQIAGALSQGVSRFESKDVSAGLAA